MLTAFDFDLFQIMTDKIELFTEASKGGNHIVSARCFLRKEFMKLNHTIS